MVADPSRAHQWHRRRGNELSPAELYAVLRLRTDVFVVEQECPYPELDGQDLVPSTEHWWISAAGDGDGSDQVLTYLRVLGPSEGSCRIGRVVTSPEARGTGLASGLLTDAVGAVGRPVELSAQSHLVAWYQRFGFEVVGPEFLEDGIPHLPMRLR